MLQNSPWFGAGLSGYPAALSPYHKDTFFEIFQYPHNIFLNFWSELGLGGLLVLLVMTIKIIRQTIKTIKIKPRQILTLAAVAALLQMAIHGLVDVPFFKNDLAVMTFVLLAMISASTNVDAEKKS